MTTSHTYPRFSYCAQKKISLFEGSIGDNFDDDLFRGTQGLLHLDYHCPHIDIFKYLRLRAPSGWGYGHGVVPNGGLLFIPTDDGIVTAKLLDRVIVDLFQLSLDSDGPGAIGRLLWITQGISIIDRIDEWIG